MLQILKFEVLLYKYRDWARFLLETSKGETGVLN